MHDAETGRSRGGDGCGLSSLLRSKENTLSFFPVLSKDAVT